LISIAKAFRPAAARRGPGG